MRPPQSTRRRFLALTAGAVLAGCTSPGDDDSDAATDTGTPTATDTATPYDRGVDHSLEAWADYDREWTAPTDAPPTAFETEVLVENMEIPWDVSFAADGTLFVTERVGRVVAVDGDDVRTVAEPTRAIDAESIPPGSDEGGWWVKGGEGGTLGVAAHPTYPDPPLVYLYYTYEAGDGRYNRVSAFDVSVDDPASTESVVVEGIAGGKIHNGGRLTFGPANYLWVTCGDGGNGKRAQDPAALAGAVLKLTPDGDPAPDNPGLADPRVYTYGHRNPQGIGWLPDGTPVVSEHGPNGRDEINRLAAGGNYGWPDVRDREAYLEAPDVHPPLANTGGNTWAPSGSLFYTGDGVPGLRNRLLTCGLGGQQVLVTTMTPPDGERPPAEGGTVFDGDWSDDAYTATTHPVLGDQLGRVRHVEQGPDGGLYLTTSNRDGRAGEGFPTERDDRLVRLTPVS